MSRPALHAFQMSHRGMRHDLPRDQCDYTKLVDVALRVEKSVGGKRPSSKFNEEEEEKKSVGGSSKKSKPTFGQGSHWSDDPKQRCNECGKRHSRLVGKRTLFVTSVGRHGIITKVNAKTKLKQARNQRKQGCHHTQYNSLHEEALRQAKEKGLWIQNFGDKILKEERVVRLVYEQNGHFGK